MSSGQPKQTARSPPPSQPRRAPPQPLLRSKPTESTTEQSKVPRIANKPMASPDVLRKRKNGLWAIGVAVIVGAGAILGSQLKTQQQERDRFKTSEQEETGVQTSVATTDATERKTQAILEQEKNLNRALAEGVSSNAGGVTSNQRQISFLEDRRGVLMKQKFDLEKKIERVREKRRREEDVEARRATNVGGDT